MNEEIEKLLESVFWNFEYRRKKDDQKGNLLFPVFETIILPVMKEYIELAKKKGFNVAWNEKKSKTSCKYSFRFENDYRDKLLEITFYGNFRSPQVSCVSCHTFKGLGQGFEDLSYPLQDLTRQTIHDCMTIRVKKLLEYSLREF